VPSELSLRDARRIALRWQGFVGHRSGADTRRLRAIVSRLGGLQIDSVNVLVRSHYLTAYSRIGAFNLVALDRLVRSERAFVEQGANWVTQLVPMELFPVFQSLREASKRAPPADTIARIEEARPGYVEAVLAEVTERGPLSFGELSDPGRTPCGRADNEVRRLVCRLGKVVLGRPSAEGFDGRGQARRRRARTVLRAPI
jgi:uncharacterized protein